MSSARRSCPELTGVLALALALACLPEPRAPEGVQLYAGQRVERITPIDLDGRSYLSFALRREPLRDDRGGRVDLLVVPADGAQPARVALAGRVDSPRFPLIDIDGRQRHFWAMREERSYRHGGQTLLTGTLTRFDLVRGVQEEIPLVMSYGLVRAGPLSGALWYQRPTAGAGAVDVEFVVRDLQGRVRVLRGVQGVPTFDASGVIYYFAGDDRVLHRLRGLDAPAEPLRAGVSRFLPAGRYAILTVPDGERPATVVFDLETRGERRLPGERICCWTGLLGSGANLAFAYAEGAGGGQPARLWRVNLQTGEATSLDLPAGMADMVGELRRPGTSQRLYIDSRNTLALYDPEQPVEARFRLLDLRPANPRFIHGGRYFLYVEPIPGDLDNEGRLMIGPGDFSAPPRVLTPLGTKLSPAQRLFELVDDRGTPEPEDDRALLVFWARFGRTASDLYFADLETLQVERKAEAIREVSVTPTTLLGIVRTSLQDLVGDLVFRDLRTGRENVIAHGVDNFNVLDDEAGRRIAYYRRGRNPSSMDGIWVAPLEPFLTFPPGAAAVAARLSEDHHAHP